jgi:SSS family solute:Na+ symporter
MHYLRYHRRAVSYLLIIVAYSAAQIALGVWVARRVKGSSDFFVAGRSLGAGLLATTLLAANIGAGSTVGAAGRGYRDGFAAWWWVGSAAIGSVGLAVWAGPRIWRLATAHQFKTVGDFLEWRYDSRVRAAIAALLWLGTVSILAAQLLAMAAVLGTIAGLSKVASCVAGAAVATTYFAAGGLKSSVAVNALQLTVKLAGFAVAVPLSVAAVGGVDGFHHAFPPGPYWSGWSNGESGWSYLAIVAPGFIVSPGILQKVYAAKDERAVRAGVGINAIVLLAFAAIPAILGMIARARHPELLPANTDLALPTLFRYDLPFWVGAVGLAAIFSAEISAADALLFMLATSFSQDLYKRFFSPGADDASVLRVARMGAVAGAALAIGVALSVAKDVVDALGIFYTLLGVGLFVPIVAGLYSRRGNARAALASIAAGVAVAPWTSAIWGIAAAMAAFGIVSMVGER